MKKIFAAAIYIAVLAAMVTAVFLIAMMIAIITLNFSTALFFYKLVEIGLLLVSLPATVIVFSFVTGQAKGLFGCNETGYKVWRFALWPTYFMLASWQALELYLKNILPSEISLWWPIIILFFLPILAGLIRKKFWR